MQALRNLDSGSLRIGASTTIATYMIPEYLGVFHRAFPGIDLHVVSANTSDIAALMLGHEIEIALVEGPVEDENLISEAWRTDVMALIAGPDHRFAAVQGPIDIRSLNDEILIVREPGSGTREVVAQALAAHHVEPQRTLEIGSTEAIKQAVASGVGVAIVSIATIDDQVKLGKLKVIPIKGVHIERTLWQLKSPGRLDVPAAVAFEGIIRETKGTKTAPPMPAARARRTDPAPSNGMLEAERAWLEIDGPCQHDANHQHPEHAGARGLQPFRHALARDRRIDRGDRLAEGIGCGLAHRRNHQEYPENVATTGAEARVVECLLRRLLGRTFSGSKSGGSISFSTRQKRDEIGLNRAIARFNAC
ncbi:LysR substrate-binding domain-containing protein [Bradyrhizobium sp. 13971]